MGSGGYHKKARPVAGGPVPPIDGIEVSSNPVEFVEADALHTVESPENGKSQGDQPSFSMPAFADGKDMRHRG